MKHLLPATLIMSLSASALAVDFNLGQRVSQGLEVCDQQYWQGNQDTAWDCYQEALSSDSLALRAEAAWALDDKQQANRWFDQAARLEPDNAKLLSRWGDLYAATYQNQQALDLYVQALAIEPDNSFAQLGKWTMLLDSEGQEAAMNLAEMAETLAVAPGARYRAALLLAEQSLKGQQMEQADRLLGLARQIQQSGNLTEIPLKTLEIAELVRSKQSPDAELEALAAQYPGYGGGYEKAGEFLVLGFKYRECQDYFNKAVAMQPDLWTAHLQLAANALRLNRATLAREHFTLAYQGDPFNPEAVNSMRLMDTYESFEVLNFPPDDSQSLLPKLSLRLDPDESPVLSPYVSELAEKAIATFSQRYQFNLQETAVVEVYPHHDDFIVRALGMPGVPLLGVAFGYLVAMDSPTAKAGNDYHWGTTLWHEMAHIFTLEASGHEVPRWFSEGVSVYEEWNTGPMPGERVSNSVLESVVEHGFLPVLSLNSGFTQPEYDNQVIVSYMQAGLICQFISQRFSHQMLVDWLAGYRQGENTESMINTRLDMTPQDFDREFGAWFERNYGEIIQVLPAWRERMQAASAAYQSQQWQAVVDYAEQAISLIPGYTEPDSPLLLKAYALKKLDDGEGSRLALDTFWRNGGYAPGRLVELAKVYAEEEQMDTAIELVKQSIYGDPFAVEAHRLLGDWSLDKGDAAIAQREYEVALELDPLDKAPLLTGLAQALQQQGDKEQARRRVLEALDLAPHYRPAQQLLMSLMGAS